MYDSSGAILALCGITQNRVNPCFFCNVDAGSQDRSGQIRTDHTGNLEIPWKYKQIPQGGSMGASMVALWPLVAAGGFCRGACKKQ